ncbi:hypothetical protein ACQ7B5_00350 [Escherichia coli]
MSEFRRWKGEKIDGCKFSVRKVRRRVFLWGYFLFVLLLVVELVFFVWLMPVE